MASLGLCQACSSVEFLQDSRRTSFIAHRTQNKAKAIHIVYVFPEDLTRPLSFALQQFRLVIEKKTQAKAVSNTLFLVHKEY